MAENKWVTGVITPISGVTTLLITCRGAVDFTIPWILWELVQLLFDSTVSSFKWIQIHGTTVFFATKVYFLASKKTTKNMQHKRVVG